MRAVKDGIVVSCTIKTNAKASSVTFADESFSISTTSSPIENKANKEVTELLAEVFSVRRSDVSIISGAKSKSKTVLIKNISEEAVRDIAQKLQKE
ncbi:uncharacterized protein NECID01_1098 [Nematocida sp. AWRm77]|nr:uncharacterized protein NECID01_1098 [Nematocida sp. AWRm77]